MKEILKKDQLETMLNEEKIEHEKINILEGIRTKKLQEQAKVQIFNFQRMLEEAELKRIRELLQKIQLNQEFLDKTEKLKEKYDKERTIAAEEIYKNFQKLKNYLKERKLEVDVETKLKPKKQLLFKKPKRIKMKENSQTLTMSADGNMDDQQNEYLYIEGRMSRADIERIKSFQARLRELDQQIDLNNNDLSNKNLEDKEWLRREYSNCVGSMVSYIAQNVRGGTIRSVPEKELNNQITKARTNHIKTEQEQSQKIEEKKQERQRTIGARKQEY